MAVRGFTYFLCQITYLESVSRRMSLYEVQKLVQNVNRDPDARQRVSSRARIARRTSTS